MDERPIGLFDSGVGGLSVLKEVRRELPHEQLIYFADQAHVPYGPRPTQEIRHFSEQIASLLLSFNIKLLVVACNTASAAALGHLRTSFPRIQILGMENAIVQAARSTRNGNVGLLATTVTLQGSFFRSIVRRLGEETNVVARTPHGLVEQIEAGDLEGPAVRAALEEALMPMQTEGMDTLVLACTHYPFIAPTLRALLSAEVQIVDPAPTIAAQTKTLLEEHQALATGRREPGLTYITSGDRRKLLEAARRLIDIPGEAREARWREGSLYLVEAKSKE